MVDIAVEVVEAISSGAGDRLAAKAIDARSSPLPPDSLAAVLARLTLGLTGAALPSSEAPPARREVLLLVVITTPQENTRLASRPRL